MKVCTCFLLFGILAYTHSFASNTPKSNQRNVNLALETVLEFSNKDKENDIKFLNNVQKFISKVKTVINENSNGNNLRRNNKAPRVKTFTEFIQDVIQILNTYEDTAFADFFDILDEEIRNYHYIGCRFYELTENYEIRELIGAKLDSIKGKPISVTKAYINALSDMLKNYHYDRHVKKIVKYINSLYKQEAEEGFQKVISDLEGYGRSKSKRSNNKLGKIIKNGVRSIIFDHYTNLNTNVRRDVKQRIETFWRQFKNKTPSRDNKPNVKPYSKSKNNAENSENITNEVKKPEPVSGKDLMNITNKKTKQKKRIKIHENNKDRTEIKQSEYKKAEIQRDDMKIEKKRYIKHTINDTVDEPLDIQESETSLNSQHTGPIINQQWIKNEHQKRNIDSLSGESFNSIEFYQEPHHKTKQYIAINPKNLSQKSSTNVIKKLEKIEALNMSSSTNNTVKKIWIEESTGRLPKVVLDKLALQASEHESRHKKTDKSLNKHSHKYKKKHDKDQKMWHGKIYEPKYVKMYGKKDDKKHAKKHVEENWSKNDIRYESRQKQKSKQHKKHKYDKTSDPNDPFILVHNRDFFRQNYVRTTDSVFTMETHQFKKSMGPLRVELKQNKRLGTASTKSQHFLEVLDILMPSKTGKTIKSQRARRIAAPRVKLNEIRRMRPIQQTSPTPITNFTTRNLTVAVPRVYSKDEKKILSWKPEWHFKKSAEPPSSSDEGMTLETSEIKDDKSHGHNAKRTSCSLQKDPYVIERIKNVERQLNEVKSRINFYSDVVTEKKVTHSFVANNDVVKHKQTETRFRSDVNNFHNDYKVSQNKLKMGRSADNKTKHIIRHKYVKHEDPTMNEMDILNGKSSETKFKSDVSMIPNVLKYITDKTKEADKPDDKTDVKHNDFKNKEVIVKEDNEIKKFTKQKKNIKKEKKPEISLTNIGNVSTKAKDKGIKVTMNDYDGDDTLKATGTENKKIASLSTSTNAIESTTKTTTTVQPTVAVTTPTTLKLLTISIYVPVATSPKLADVLQKAEVNVTLDKTQNKMTNNTSQVADVSITTLNVTKDVSMKM